MVGVSTVPPMIITAGRGSTGVPVSPAARPACGRAASHGYGATCRAAARARCWSGRYGAERAATRAVEQRRVSELVGRPDHLAARRPGLESGTAAHRGYRAW